MYNDDFDISNENINKINNVNLEFKIEDTYENYNTRTLLYGKELNTYYKNILFEVYKYYNYKDMSRDGSYVSTERKQQIIKFLHKVFERKDLNYDKLMQCFGAKTHECLLAYMLIAFKTETKNLDLILRCMYTYGRVLPFDSKNEWFDNYRLNNYGNPLNMVMWKKYDSEHIYTIDVYEPKPINSSVKLNFNDVIKFLVGSLRAFIINNNLYPGCVKRSSNAGEQNRKLTAEQICDECYLHYPYYYGGAHGCDVFDIGLTLTLEEITKFLNRYPSARVGYILNTATYKSGKGEHWVALELTKGKAKMICSQQSDFTVFHDGGVLDSKLKRLLYGQEWNTKRLQNDSYNCGIFSSLALYEMLCHNSDIYASVEAIGENASNIKRGVDIDDIREKLVGVK